MIARSGLVLATTIVLLSGCGGSDSNQTSQAPAGSTTSVVAEAPTNDAPAKDAPVQDAAPKGDYCKLAGQLNDVDVSEDNPDPAAVKQFIDITGQLKAAAPSEIRGQATTYFDGLADLARQGGSADLEDMSREMQDAFNAVATFTIKYCDK